MTINWQGVDRIAVIGECMLELSAAGDNGLKQLAYGGDTLNTSMYMAKAGCKVDYVSALGDDPHSAMMIDAWQRAGINCQLVVRKPGRLPGLYMIETDQHGERSFYYWRDQAPARELFDNADEADGLFAALLNFPLLYLSGVTLSLYSATALKRLLSFLSRYRAAGGLVAFDSNFRPQRWPDLNDAQQIFCDVYRQTDIALPTLDDEQLLFSVVNSEQLAAQLAAFGVSEIVIKRGAKGCDCYTDDEHCWQPAISVANIVDTTGAGDSFNAGYLSARMQGLSVAQAAQRGHHYASQVVGQCGAIVDID